MRDPYVVVLAGGEGTRLAPLTRALYGTDLPKQFAVLSGDRSLLQHTIERARALTTLDRIIVVVTSHREALAREQLAAYPGVELVTQPRNLDTGPGLLLPLVHIRARAPSADVVFLPSDHYIASPESLLAALRETRHLGLRERVTLIGVKPSELELEYGWIVPGDRLRPGVWTVARFEEKPARNVASELWRCGALWNTFISAGPVDLYWTLAGAQLPEHTSLLERYADAIGGCDERDALVRAYAAMTPANFSRDVLAKTTSLAVQPVSEIGWSDWGCPRRVFASLAGTPCHDRLLERVGGDLAALAS